MKTEKKNRYFVSGLLLAVIFLGSINLISCGGSSSSPVIYSIAPSSALTPTSGTPPALSVTLTGANFGSIQGTSIVQFNGGVNATTAWSDSAIVTGVPTLTGMTLTNPSAVTVPVVVIVGGAVSNAVTFVYNITGP